MGLSTVSLFWIQAASIMQTAESCFEEDSDSIRAPCARKVTGQQEVDRRGQGDRRGNLSGLV